MKLLHVCLKIGIDRNQKPDFFNFKNGEPTYVYSAWVIHNSEIENVKKLYDQNKKEDKRRRIVVPGVLTACVNKETAL